MAVREMAARDVALLAAAMILIIGLIMCATALAISRNARLAADFDLIHVGLTNTEVLAVLGKPS